ncbi:MAG: phytanoyl-CoA dioxygenase family protein [Gammaproteobacteria bacterium]|nr:phytanoyl-CoA dioxygenase family protein [Gammaproteobacteria bacterium]
MTDRYFEEGEARARALGNRGPLELDAQGMLARHVLDTYWREGFYVFEGVVQPDELRELVTDFESVLDRAPRASGAHEDARGRPAIGTDFERPSFKFARPLSDPNGGTGEIGGRYQAKMVEHAPPPGAPTQVVLQMSGILQLMDSALRLYGHPQLLRVAEQINGPDFTPFTDTIWVKQPGLGASVSWHQDGTTHWDNPELDAGTHGFNFMVQLYGTTPQNALWVVPGTHHDGKIDIRERLATTGGTDRLPDAVPMLCQPGDVAICNRQVLHGSFANTSEHPRATFVFGFHRRASVLGAQGWWSETPYDDARILARSRIIALAVDARRQRFPTEVAYEHAALAEAGVVAHWDEAARESVLKNYNLNDLGI